VAGKLNAVSGSLFGNLNTATIGTISKDKYATTLNITSDFLASTMQTYIDTEVTTLNNLLAAGVVIPPVAGINLSDLEINFFEGYTEFGINVTPTFWA